MVPALPKMNGVTLGCRFSGLNFHTVHWAREPRKRKETSLQKAPYLYLYLRYIFQTKAARFRKPSRSLQAIGTGTPGQVTDSATTPLAQAIGGWVGSYEDSLRALNVYDGA